METPDRWLNGGMEQRLRPTVGAALRLAAVPQIIGLALLVVVGVLWLSAGSGGTLELVLVAAAALFLVVSLVVLWWRPWLLRVDQEGYRVRFVRGAGATTGSWTDVRQAVTAVVDGTRCLVLRRTDGQQTIIPVDLLDADAEDFVRRVRALLQQREGRARP